MLIAIVPLLVAIAGVLIYAFADKTPKLAEVGRILFFVGALWTAYALATKTVKIGAVEPAPLEPTVMVDYVRL